jgi:tetratricopeptide (TPR) repeat protein
MRLFSLFLLVSGLLAHLPAQAQPDNDQLLAIQYYNGKEYDKAVVLFEKLYQRSQTSQGAYRYYLNCLVYLERFSDAESLIKKQLRRTPDQLTLFVDLGYVAKQSGDPKKADKYFKEAVEALPADRTEISQLANAFIGVMEFEQALATYDKGERLLRDYTFSLERAMLAQRRGDMEAMIAHYLDFLSHDPAQSERVRTAFQEEMEDEVFARMLTSQLYQRLQTSPDDIVLTEMLTWVLIQKKDFAGALRQMKALDRRLREQGRRVHDLATTLMSEKEFDIAAEAYSYLVEIGRNGAYYFYGREGVLRARKGKITSRYDYTEQDLATLKQDYQAFIEEFGFNKAQAAPTMRELAQLEAFYIHNTDRAIEILDELVKIPGLSPHFLAGCKLDLGDCYLLRGDRWEATLLYSQVDKQMKDDPLGEEARYRNARWWYYQGDFLWAQAQLDVLKASTSELIANDALNLSVFITDHLGLDSTSVPMMMFARADLLAFQNRHGEAVATLDSIENRFPDHTLQDDIWLLKSDISMKRHEVDQAIDFLDRIANGHPGSILVDDALFRLGDLYEHVRKEPEKAMAYYERILVEQKGSIFVVEARERFRRLRGDKLN